MDTAAVTVADLRKSYGATPAVDGVSFAVRREEVFGLLGPNGVGKTTILLHGRIVATGTPREPTAGADETTRISVRTVGDSLSADRPSVPGLEHRTQKDGYHLYFTDRPGPSVAALMVGLNSAFR